MVRVIHGADFHLDSPFAGLSPQRAVRRRQEQRELLDRLVELCRDSRADLVLLSGDLLDGGRTFYETNQALASALGRMEARVFLAPGNHDYYHGRSPYALLRWPENVHIFTGGWERVALPELGCVVYGAAFTAPRQETSLLDGFRPEQDEGHARLMVLHADVDAPQSRYDPVTSAQLAGSGMDYAALGHVHAFSGVNRAGDTAWAYPGCPEGRGFDELGEKGVLRGTVDRGEVKMEFVPLCRRRYLIQPVDVTGREDLAAAVAEGMSGVTAEDICRVVLTGERGLERLDLEALLPAVEARCWQGEVQDRTVLRRDLWARRGEDSLTGLFLGELAARLERCEDEQERELLERAARFGLAALEGGEDR